MSVESNDTEWSGKESEHSEGNSFPDLNPVWKEVVHNGDDQIQPSSSTKNIRELNMHP
jgi:hypothetical protein